MAGVFKTTPVGLLHNLTSVPPISYVLNKLTHSYSLKLQGMVPNAKTRIILYHNLCQYWPEYIHPTTNLTWAFLKPAESMYWPLNPATTGLWGKLRFTYLLTSPPHILTLHKCCLVEQDLHTLYIIVSPCIYDTQPLIIYKCFFGGHKIYKGCKKGVNYMQAKCQAVYDALHTFLPLHNGLVSIWL
jgi:hypothetical protein